MAYVDFPSDLKGQRERKAFWLSPQGLTLIAGWRRQGTPVTKIISDYVGVSKTAWFGWYRESEELRKTIANSKDVVNMSVEEALLKKALGYDYVEKTYELIEGELRLTKEQHKHMPPDTKAILSWLYNRLPNQWRSMQEPLEATQYVETVRNILIAMRNVAENGQAQQIEVKEGVEKPQLP